MAADSVKPCENWPPAARLRKRAEYQRVFSGGRVVRTPYFILYWLPNTVGTARLGLQVGRRAARKAVQRNRWKRWAREVFRRHRYRWPAVDVVFIARPAMQDLTFHTFRKTFLQAMRRIVRCHPGAGGHEDHGGTR